MGRDMQKRRHLSEENYREYKGYKRQFQARQKA
jgi:hypothetical protein